jgi:hypothetical protein
MSVARSFASVRPHAPLIKFRKGGLVPKSAPPPPIETEALPQMTKTIQTSINCQSFPNTINCFFHFREIWGSSIFSLLGMVRNTG